MDNIRQSWERIDWTAVSQSLNKYGYAILPGFLSHPQCDELSARYAEVDSYRKTIQMERYRFGRGEYKYFDYPLPSLIEEIRTSCYPHLSRIANDWMTALGMEKRFPEKHTDLISQCQKAGQHKATPLILHYEKGGYNTLHQDLYGEVFFPLQLLLMLSQPVMDYEGGEFVLTEQVPRAQSKAIVLRPGKGDAVVFTTQYRPAKGSKGYYRVNMKHGVSEVTNGQRYTLGIIFHDAQS